MESSDDDIPWLPKLPKVLRVDKKAIFALAAEEFKLTVESEETLEIDADSFVTKITVGNIMARKSGENEPKEFTGASAQTKKQSIQHAYQAVLSFLEKEQMVIIDDYNAPHVTKLKEELLYHSSWHMLFEDKVAKLLAAIKATNTGLTNLLAAFDSACASSSTTPATKRRRLKDGTNTSNANHAEPPSSLSQSLSRLRGQILALLGNEAAERMGAPATI